MASDLLARVLWQLRYEAWQGLAVILDYPWLLIALVAALLLWTINIRRAGIE